MEPIHFFVAHLEQLEGDYRRTLNEDEEGYSQLSPLIVVILIISVNESGNIARVADGSSEGHIRRIAGSQAPYPEGYDVYRISEKNLLAFRDVDLSKCEAILSRFHEIAQTREVDPIPGDLCEELLHTLVRLSTIALDRRKQLFFSILLRQ